MPKISIIIPLYNKEAEIERTILSVLHQNYRDFELVVVNDGSTDGSLNVINSISDVRVRVVSQENAGVSAARNRGIKEAKGDYVLLLDADDILLPDALDVVSYADGFDVVLGSFIQSDSQGNIVSQSINSHVGELVNVFQSYWNRDFYVRMGSFLINREYLTQIEPFRTDMTLYEDLEWLLRVLSNAKVYVTNQLLLDYNRGETGLSWGLKPIEKDFAKEASVKNVKDKYKKRIIGDFVFRRFFSRLKAFDRTGLQVIWSNNSGSMIYCFIMCFISYRKQKKNNTKTCKANEEENVLPGLSNNILKLRKIANSIRSWYMLNIRYSDVKWGGQNLLFESLPIPRYGHLIRM